MRRSSDHVLVAAAAQLDGTHLEHADAVADAVRDSGCISPCAPGRVRARGSHPSRPVHGTSRRGGPAGRSAAPSGPTRAASGRTAAFALWRRARARSRRCAVRGSRGTSRTAAPEAPADSSRSAAPVAPWHFSHLPSSKPGCRFEGMRCSAVDECAAWQQARSRLMSLPLCASIMLRRVASWQSRQSFGTACVSDGATAPPCGSWQARGCLRHRLVRRSPLCPMSEWHFAQSSLTGALSRSFSLEPVRFVARAAVAAARRRVRALGLHRARDRCVTAAPGPRPGARAVRRRCRRDRRDTRSCTGLRGSVNALARQFALDLAVAASAGSPFSAFARCGLSEPCAWQELHSPALNGVCFSLSCMRRTASP